MKSSPRYYVALDLGAGSGRAMLGTYDGQALSLEEIHRFPNEPVTLPDGLYWNALRLWKEINTGVLLAAQKTNGALAGIAVDTWGVDYALLDHAGRLLANPHNYRDPRTDGMLDEAFKRMPREKLFGSTGIQFMQINTAFQLLSQALHNDPVFPIAKHLLMMPDLFGYWFTGKHVAERSIASTSQCYNPVTRAWATDVLDALDIPAHLFPPLVDPGHVLGPVRPELATELGLTDTPIINVGSHDTASAVAAVPLTGDDEAYLSSGTWSLLGVECPDPVINAESLRYNFTNETGVCNTIRLLKNITGLWIIQEMKRVWNAAGDPITYDDMADLAQAAPAFKHFIDNDDPLFMQPGDMPSRIAEYCQRTGQPIPADRGATIRAAFESLVFKYRWVVELLEKLTGRSIRTIIIVGGGTKNTFLNQWAATATGRVIKTGPTEATAAGNIMLQMMATGALTSLEEGRAMIRASFASTSFEPQDTAAWNAAYRRYLDITGLASM